MRIRAMKKQSQNKPNFDKGQNKPNPLYKKDLRKFYTPSDNEKQTQYEPNQSRSEFTPKGAEIPTGELLRILKPGTNLNILPQNE